MNRDEIARRIEGVRSELESATSELEDIADDLDDAAGPHMAAALERIVDLISPRNPYARRDGTWEDVARKAVEIAEGALSGRAQKHGRSPLESRGA